MFLASLAFNADAGESINALSRLGILLGSTVSAIVGYMALKVTTAKNKGNQNDGKTNLLCDLCIWKNRETESFLQCASDSHIVPISAVTKEQVSLLGNSSALFNLKKAEELLDRTPNNKRNCPHAISYSVLEDDCWKINSYKIMILL